MENHTPFRSFGFGLRSRTDVHGLLLWAILGNAACSGDNDAKVTTSGTGGVAGASASVSGAAGVGTSGAAGAANTAGNAGKSADVDYAARYFEPNHLIEVAIELDANDWDALRAEERSINDIILGSDCQSAPFPDPFTWKRANVTVDGVLRSQAGIRKKGFLGSLDKRRPSLKISLDQFTSQDLFGVRDFTFNNVKQDPTIISQCLGYLVFAKADLPAPRCNFAHVTVNGLDLGVYTHVEPIKKPFLRRHFSSDEGDLYEGTLSDFRDGWLGTFEPKTPETDTTKQGLHLVAEAVAAPAEELVTRLGGVLDLSAFTAFWATETALAHLDGYSRNTNNFYVYIDPDNGLASLLPWGADMLFGNEDASASTDNPLGKYTQGAIVNALYSSSAGRSLLLKSLQTTLDVAWDEAALVAEAKRMAALVKPKLNAQQAVSFDAALVQLQEFVNTRRAALTKAIATPPTNAEALRAPACLLPAGSVSGTFATTWGTTGAINPFTAGTGTLDVIVSGTPWPNRAGSVGAVAGLNPDSTAEQEGQVVVPALRMDGKASVMAFGFDLVDAKPGTLTLDLGRVPGVLLKMDPAVAGSEEVVGVLVGGKLTFEQIGTTSGDPVKGSFGGTLYHTPFLNGF